MFDIVARKAHRGYRESNDQCNVLRCLDHVVAERFLAGEAGFPCLVDSLVIAAPAKAQCRGLRLASDPACFRRWERVESLSGNGNHVGDVAQMAAPRAMASKRGGPLELSQFELLGLPQVEFCPLRDVPRDHVDVPVITYPLYDSDSSQP